MINQEKLKRLCSNENNYRDTLKWQMREMLARKVSSVIWGDGYIFQTEDKAIEEKFRKFEKMNKFLNILSFVERYLSMYGRCIITINKTKTGEVMLNIPNPFYFNQVGKVFVNPQIAVIWQKYKVDTKSYVVKTTYDCEKVVNEVYENNENVVRVFDKEADILKEFQLEKVWYHNLGFVPVVEFTNISFFQFEFNNLEYNMLADWVPATQFEDAAYITLQNYNKEAINCHSRILISNASQELIDKVSRLKNKYIEFDIDLDDFILETDMGGEFKPQPGTADLTKYTQALDHIMDFYVKFAGGSRFSEGGGAQKTVAETSTIRSQLVESINNKIILRKEQVSDLLKKVFCAYGLIKDYWDDKEYFDFTVNGNIVKDETQFIDNQIKLVETGAQTMVQLIQKVFNVSLNKAEELFNETKKFNEENNIVPSMSAIDFKEEEDYTGFNKTTGEHISADKQGVL